MGRSWRIPLGPSSGLLFSSLTLLLVFYLLNILENKLLLSDSLLHKHNGFKAFQTLTVHQRYVMIVNSACVLFFHICWDNSLLQIDRIHSFKPHVVYRGSESGDQQCLNPDIVHGKGSVNSLILSV